MKKLFSFSELTKITKVSLAIVPIFVMSLTLISFSGGVGESAPLQFANVIITVDEIIEGSWLNESQYKALQIKMSTKLPSSSAYWGAPGKVNLEKLVQNPYYLGSRYYATGSAFPTEICIDGTSPSLSAIYPSDPNKQSVIYNNTRVDLSGKIWFQVMSQCEDGKGLWWKFEKQYFPGDYPLTVNDTKGKATLTFQYVTTNCKNNGKIYGCGFNDNK